MANKRDQNQSWNNQIELCLLSLLGDNNVLWIAYETNVFLNLEVNELVNGFLDGIDCRPTYYFC